MNFNKILSYKVYRFSYHKFRHHMSFIYFSYVKHQFLPWSRVTCNLFATLSWDFTPPLPFHLGQILWHVKFPSCLLLCDTKTWVRIHRPVHLNLDSCTCISGLSLYIFGQGQMKKIQKEGAKKILERMQLCLIPYSNNEHLWSELVSVTIFFFFLKKKKKIKIRVYSPSHHHLNPG